MIKPRRRAVFRINTVIFLFDCTSLTFSTSCRLSWMRYSLKTNSLLLICVKKVRFSFWLKSQDRWPPPQGTLSKVWFLSTLWTMKLVWRMETKFCSRSTVALVPKEDTFHQTANTVWKPSTLKSSSVIHRRLIQSRPFRTWQNKHPSWTDWQKPGHIWQWSILMPQEISEPTLALVSKCSWPSWMEKVLWTPSLPVECTRPSRCKTWVTPAFPCRLRKLWTGCTDAWKKTIPIRERTSSVFVTTHSYSSPMQRNFVCESHLIESACLVFDLVKMQRPAPVATNQHGFTLYETSRGDPSVFG